jgi:hypothetical protein
LASISRADSTGKVSHPLRNFYTTCLWACYAAKVQWGEDPIGMVVPRCYLICMNILLVLLVLLLLFGGGGFYFGGPAIGGGGLGLVLVICLIVYCMGGFRTKA